MCPIAHRAPSLLCLVALFTLATALAGCSRPSAGISREEFDKANPEIAAHRMQIAKFSGQVTVDGGPPAEGTTLFVLLNDPEHPNPNPKILASCDADGHFAFKTYEQGDGVPVGKYVVELVALKKQFVKGRARVIRYVGPDALKNLYNDPEKNKNRPEFLVDVQEPGRTDYEFALTVAGKDAASPGKFSATTLSGM
jgi:hypothetical protein